MSRIYNPTGLYLLDSLRLGDFALALSLNSISRFTRELPDEGALT